MRRWGWGVYHSSSKKTLLLSNSQLTSEEALSSTSPEFGTDGYYAKCWVRENDGIYLYKSGSDTYEIEPLSEFLACQLAEQICPQAVHYDLGFYHQKTDLQVPPVHG